MPLTPLTAAVPYALAADLFDYHDANAVADLLRDADAPRPLVPALKVTTTPLGARLYRLLLAASGEFESAVLEGKRYQPADLQALTGAAKELLVRLVCNLCFWRLCQRRQPMSADPEQVPGAKQAEEALQKLQQGVNVLGFAEAAEAGLDQAVQSRIVDPTGAYRPITDRARTLFGTHGPANTGGV